MRKTILVTIVVLLGICLWVAAMAGDDSGPSVVVYFDNGKAVLNSIEKVKVRKLFQTYDVSGAGRVFVLGYTDSRGAKNKNYELSRKRAQAVRREIISSFGIDAAVVMSLGKGPENPVAGNTDKDGRARNRRAEIYLANAAVRRPPRVYGPKDPHLPDITTLVEEADVLVRERRFELALKKLGQAHAIGGDHYSDWHTVKGIAGYYAGVAQVKVKAHLATAVQLDPYNFKAREYLSRLQARNKVTSGKVNAQMGQSPEDAIPVTAGVQVYEYMQLFGVEPVAHRELRNKPIDIWECLDEKGVPVVYHFNHAPIYGWAYARNSTALSSQTAKTRQSAQEAGPKAQPLVTDKPGKIWESKIFQ